MTDSDGVSELAAIHGVGSALFLLMALPMAVTVAAAVQLFLHARRNRTEIMPLVCSPSRSSASVLR